MHPRQDIAAVAFDLDGTLYPDYRLNCRLIPFVLREWRLLWAFGKARRVIRAAQRQTEPEENGRPLFYDLQARYAAEVLGENPALVKEKIERLIYRGWARYFADIVLFPHVTETLTAFRKAGCKLALLSDFPPEEKIEKLGLNGFWDAVLCSERSGALKPAALPFRDLANALGMAGEKILYVGNNYRYDILGARGVGMKTAWITRPLAWRRNPAPDFTFWDYRQLVRFMIQ